MPKFTFGRILSLCISAFLATASQAISQTAAVVNGPSLAETSNWIKNTFPQKSGNSSCFEYDSTKPDSEYGQEFSCSITSYDIDLLGCDVKLYSFHKQTAWNCPTSGCTGDKSKRDDYRAEFNLRDIDPDSIQAGPVYGSFGLLSERTYHTNEPQIDIQLATTNSERKISLVYVNSGDTFREDHLGSFLSKITVETDYAPRFVKALHHAALLCGAKPSAF